MFLFGFFILFLKKPSFSMFIDNFWISGVYLMGFTALMICVIIIFGIKDKKPLKWSIMVFFLYIPFGILQEILFQFVFTDTLFELTGNPYITIFLSSIYYMLFHLRLDLGTFTFIAGLFWSYFYLAFGNVFWIGISHAILGTMYYVFMYKGNALKNKLNYFKNSEIK